MSLDPLAKSRIMLVAELKGEIMEVLKGFLPIASTNWQLILELRVSSLQSRTGWSLNTTQ